jgi:nucleoside-diphosphate-sugar epimerase
MRKILVTGSSGMIGTRLCEVLLQAGYEVTGVDKRLNPWIPAVNAATVNGDLCRPETFARLPSAVDLVVHLAANARVFDLVVDPTLAPENIQSVFALVEFCRTNSIPRLLFASSREVYGNRKGLKRREEEACVGICESPYTASKFSGEALVSAYGRCYGIRSIVTRFSNVYGMYDASDRIVPLYIRRARHGEDLMVFGQEKVLDFTYIDDTVTGILRCIERFDAVAGHTFNISSGTGTRILDVARMIKEAMNSTSRIVIRENRRGEVVRFVADTSAARKLLGYVSKTTIAEGVAKSIAWYSYNESSTRLSGRVSVPPVRGIPSKAGKPLIHHSREPVS